MTKILLAGVLMCVLTLAWTAEAAAPDKGRSMLQKTRINGEVRSYIVYRPAMTDPSKKELLPLMIVLHGGLGNAGLIERRSAMNTIADSGPFVVAYPNGTSSPRAPDRRTWNAGRCCGPAARRNVDDVSFIKKIIDEMIVTHAVDSSRVYVTGLSNGAMLAYRLACEIPDKIAAIIPVAGTLAEDDCDRAKNVAVLHIHGDQDQNVPFNGGTGTRSLAQVNHRSVPNTVQRMIKARKFVGKVDEEILDGDIRKLSYRCSEGAPFELIVLKGAGHQWPGASPKRGPAAGTQGFNASRTAWEFASLFYKTPSGRLKLAAPTLDLLPPKPFNQAE